MEMIYGYHYEKQFYTTAIVNNKLNISILILNVIFWSHFFWINCLFFFYPLVYSGKFYFKIIAQLYIVPLKLFSCVCAKVLLNLIHLDLWISGRYLRKIYRNNIQVLYLGIMNNHVTWKLLTNLVLHIKIFY